MHRNNHTNKCHLIVSKTLINKPIKELLVIRTDVQCGKMSVSEKQKTKHQTELQFLFSTTQNACVKRQCVQYSRLFKTHSRDIVPR